MASFSSDQQERQWIREGMEWNQQSQQPPWFHAQDRQHGQNGYEYNTENVNVNNSGYTDDVNVSSDAGFVHDRKPMDWHVGQSGVSQGRVYPREQYTTREDHGEQQQYERSDQWQDGGYLDTVLQSKAQYGGQNPGAQYSDVSIDVLQEQKQKIMRERRKRQNEKRKAKKMMLKQGAEGQASQETMQKNAAGYGREPRKVADFIPLARKSPLHAKPVEWPPEKNVTSMEEPKENEEISAELERKRQVVRERRKRQNERKKAKKRMLSTGANGDQPLLTDAQELAGGNAEKKRKVDEVSQGSSPQQKNPNKVESVQKDESDKREITSEAVLNPALEEKKRKAKEKRKAQLQKKKAAKKLQQESVQQQSNAPQPRTAAATTRHPNPTLVDQIVNPALEELRFLQSEISKLQKLYENAKQRFLQSGLSQLVQVTQLPRPVPRPGAVVAATHIGQSAVTSQQQHVTATGVNPEEEALRIKRERNRLRREMVKVAKRKKKESEGSNATASDSVLSISSEGNSDLQTKDSPQRESSGPNAVKTGKSDAAPVREEMTVATFIKKKQRFLKWMTKRLQQLEAQENSAVPSEPCEVSPENENSSKTETDQTDQPALAASGVPELESPTGQAVPKPPLASQEEQHASAGQSGEDSTVTGQGVQDAAAAETLKDVGQLKPDGEKTQDQESSLTGQGDLDKVALKQKIKRQKEIPLLKRKIERLEEVIKEATENPSEFQIPVSNAARTKTPPAAANVTDVSSESGAFDPALEEKKRKARERRKAQLQRKRARKLQMQEQVGDGAVQAEQAAESGLPQQTAQTETSTDLSEDLLQSPAYPELQDQKLASLEYPPSPEPSDELLKSPERPEIPDEIGSGDKERKVETSALVETKAAVKTERQEISSSSPSARPSVEVRSSSTQGSTSFDRDIQIVKAEIVEKADIPSNTYEQHSTEYASGGGDGSLQMSHKGEEGVVTDEAGKRRPVTRSRKTSN